MYNVDTGKRVTSINSVFITVNILLFSFLLIGVCVCGSGCVCVLVHMTDSEDSVNIF